ncbi:hypothetical protein BUALT_Bualt15G0129100 [Buddleja alternifolia]|uniref:Uncharacterized protein n=1 Tax=Buddleja alternifolia TaxID=168488 RepID=A0AAV6WF36_9LAMI|nr:hypothetical protein BUALT_Bualt15G0129100 [Buddleja alternifolia]
MGEVLSSGAVLNHLSDGAIVLLCIAVIKDDFWLKYNVAVLSEHNCLKRLNEFLDFGICCPAILNLCNEVLVMGRPRKHPRGTLMGRDIDGVGGAHNNASSSRSTQSTSQVCGQPKKQSRGSTVPATTISDDSTSGSSRKGRGTSHLPPRWNTGERYELRAARSAQCSKRRKHRHRTGKTFFPVIREELKTTIGEPVPTQLDMFLETHSRGKERNVDPEIGELCDELEQQQNQVPENERTKKLKNDLYGNAMGIDGHGQITTQVKDQLKAAVSDDVREELCVEMQAEFAQVESKMKKEMEFLLTLLDPSTLQSFRATFNDSTSGVGSVHGA